MPTHFLKTPHHHYRLRNSIWQRLHLDGPLLGGIFALIVVGFIVLYSAGGKDIDVILRQTSRLILAFSIMLIFAQIPPRRYQTWAPWLFSAGTTLLFIVLIAGHIGKGAQRWLDLGLLRFQPSEFMKLSVPMMLAWYLHPRSLPPNAKVLLIACMIIGIPTFLIAKQPDLGTALLIASSGLCVILLTGIRWRLVSFIILLASAAAPALWFFMHDYQRERVLTFLNPERDPLGSGYHIIQSKIAIGSGGLFGKGWLNGTQSHLQFLPEHATDFIFGVCSEEFGLIGNIILISIYLLIIGRGLYISVQAQDTFSRLLAGSISLMFFISMFVNMGMVSGILPVVGVPLPLVSYGGTSMITVIASFGILMSIQTHRKLISM
ncbi:MAG: Peptidoglycan glycosyltransferase MrdB [Legionellaceae bacterium]